MAGIPPACYSLGEATWTHTEKTTCGQTEHTGIYRPRREDSKNQSHWHLGQELPEINFWYLHPPSQGYFVLSLSRLIRVGKRKQDSSDRLVKQDNTCKM